MKKEEKSTISKFFSRKEIKEEQESNPEENKSDKSVMLALQKCVKEELESEDKLEIPSLTKLVGHDLKSSVSTLPYEGETKCRTKRDYEELLADSKPSEDENDKLHSTPARKKANFKRDGDKQPTLLSYFGKK